jgi:putative phosphoribosyl transferase
VDDGIATGASVFAAIHALHQMKPAKIVLAVPVMPASTRDWLQTQVDKLVCLYAPEDFYAVGQFYREFNQVDDQAVIALLEEAHKTSPKPPRPHLRNIRVEEVSISLDTILLSGTLSIPEAPVGLVLFAHGSGSSRHSPRNRYVAQVLQSHGLATLLFDLLTNSEERIDQQTSQYRFDIHLLAKRLAEATRWIRRLPTMRDLRIGYFGASTGAAAALIAAAEMPDEVASVVSRGGRPDLAGGYLAHVEASVLLIIGGKDNTVLELNRKALRKLSCSDKQLVIIPGATHLFEEQGALEEAARQAADWFDRTLKHSLVSPQTMTVPARSA